MLPTLWFRNTWSWHGGVQPKPVISCEPGPHGTVCLLADDTNLPADPQIHMGCRGYSLFDEADGFFYDVLKRPDGQIRKFHVRSLVGLIPLFAVERLEVAWIEPFKEFSENLRWFLRNRPDLAADVIHPLTAADGSTTHLLTIMNIEQLTRMLTRLHDPEEFLSPYGIRSLSKRHKHEPFDFDGRRVGYEPAA